MSLYNERFIWVTSYPLLVYFTCVLYGLLRSSLFLDILSLICIQFKRSNKNLIKPRIMRWAGHVARMGQRGCTHTVVMREPEGEREAAWKI